MCADGKPLVAGKRVTGFTNSEEEAVGRASVVTAVVEDRLINNGCRYEKGPDRASFVVLDGKLVNCQNPASSEEAAVQLLSLLEQGLWKNLHSAIVRRIEHTALI